MINKTIINQKNEERTNITILFKIKINKKRNSTHFLYNNK